MVCIYTYTVVLMYVCTNVYRDGDGDTEGGISMVLAPVLNTVTDTVVASGSDGVDMREFASETGGSHAALASGPTATTRQSDVIPTVLPRTSVSTTTSCRQNNGHTSWIQQQLVRVVILLHYIVEHNHIFDNVVDVVVFNVGWLYIYYNDISLYGIILGVLIGECLLKVLANGVIGYWLSNHNAFNGLITGVILVIFVVRSGVYALMCT